MKRIYKLLLPGIILQSVLIGGGFATGREIVEYGGRFGPAGILAGVAIFIGFSLLAILSFEACRKWQVYDYKSLTKRLLGRFWIGYEATYLGLAIIIIAVMAAAAGEILQDIFGLNEWIGIVGTILAVAGLIFKGEGFIAQMKTIGTIALFGAYTLFGFYVIGYKWSEMTTVQDRILTESSVSWFSIIWTGVLYVGYNLAVYPATFFTIKEFSSTKETIISGIASGLFMTLPWFLTFFALMAFYPDPEVLEATVPWLQMLKPFSNWLIALFGIVVGWTLVETATGVIHAFISRVDNEYHEKKGRPMSDSSKSLISVAVLILALLLSQIGIIDLIAKGYGYLAYGMILFYAVPLIYHSRKIFSDKL